MRITITIILCLLISSCAWLSTLSSILPSDNKTTGHGNNNKMLVGDNSTNLGNKSIDIDDVKGDVSGRDKYNAGTITLHQTDFWELLGAAVAGALSVILTRFAFNLMNRRRRRSMFRCLRKGMRRGIGKERIKTTIKTENDQF